MTHLIITFIILNLGIASVRAENQKPETSETKITSVYTSLSKANCKTIQFDKEIGSSVQSCAGVALYGLRILEDDSRMSVSIIAPDKKIFALDYWRVITPFFSTLGDKAEWRVVKQKGQLVPIALIVRVIAQEQVSFDSPTRARSYLAVAKITKTEICVTDKILSNSAANEDARGAADNSANKACLEGQR